MASGSKKYWSALQLALHNRKLREEHPEYQSAHSDPIAIIGIGCRFPGGVSTPREFWQLLVDGRDAITEIPGTRWDIDGYYDPDPETPGKMNTRWGGFLDQVDQFDAGYFGLSPKEAESMDPQQRLLLEVCWESLNDAGYPPETLEGTATGIFVGIYNSDYARLQFSDPQAIGAHTSSGTAHSIAVGRIAYLLDLRGPNIALDTACSSSLVSVHLACQSLRAGDCATAIAGGVSLLLTPEETVSLAKWGMLAPDGRCKSFDSRADGFVRGEGCGLIVLKRLADALADGDRVHGIIRGSAVNQDGRSAVLTAPNGSAQVAVIRRALANAQVAPEQVSFVETHGTGTKIGDPIEVDALCQTIGKDMRESGARCHLGAVKANIGHLEAAAGVAGLIKAMLCMQHRMIPPQPHYRKLNPMISLGDALSISAEACEWNPPGSRIAGISSFGFGGTNAHVVLEEAPRALSGTRESAPPRAQILPLSTKSEVVFPEAALRLRESITPDLALADICYTASARRHHFRFRSAVVASNVDELLQGLERLEEQEPSDAPRSPPGIVFAFSGQGTAWEGMARGLLGEEPRFAQVIDEADQSFTTLAGWSLRSALMEPWRDSGMETTEVFQPVLFAVQMGLFALLDSWGIKPSAVVGHSVGEIAAACSAGILDIDQALELVFHRARLCQKTHGTGTMAALGLTVDEGRALILDSGLPIEIAACNGPSSISVAGPRAVLEELLSHSYLEHRFSRLLNVECPFHSVEMDRITGPLREKLAKLSPRAGQVEFYSTVTGGRLDGGALTADYWEKNLRQPVDFSGAVSSLLKSGSAYFLELGPQPVLGHYIMEHCAGNNDVAVLPTLRQGRDDRSSLLATLGELYRQGINPAWTAVADGSARLVSLPACAWQRERCWTAPDPAAARNVAASASGPLLGSPVRSPFLRVNCFEAVWGAESPGFMADHVLNGACVVPAAAFIEMGFQAARSCFNKAEWVELRDVFIHEPLVLPADQAIRVQLGVFDPNGAGRRFEIRSADEDDAGWTLHAEGLMAPGRGPVPTPACPGSEGNGQFDADQFYKRMAGRGVLFGPTFRTVRDLASSADACTATIAMETLIGATDFHIHPALLDGCLQSAEPLLPGDDGLWVPLALSRARLYGNAGGSVTCRVQREQSDESQAILGVSVFDDQGRVVIELEGLKLRTVPAEVLAKISRHQSQLLQRPIAWVDCPQMPRSSRQLSGTWAVFTADPRAGSEVAAQLREQGVRCHRVIAGKPETDLAQDFHVVDIEQPHHFVSVLEDIQGCEQESLTGVIFVAPVPQDLPSDPMAAQDHIARPALYLAQAVIKQQVPEICFVSRGAYGSDDSGGCAQSTLWGLLRVLRGEHPEIRCHMMDVNPSEPPKAQAEYVTLELKGDGAGQCVRWSLGRRLVESLAFEPVWKAPQQRLIPSPTGRLDELRWEALEEPKPAPEEVVIEVQDAGLNFRDVLTALGMMAGYEVPLGGECAGRITAVGDAVSGLHLGERVLAFARGSFQSRVSVNRNLVGRIPDGLTCRQGAGIPIAFLTARYGLWKAARIERGDRVLIHAAAGGVGLAAVQTAMAAGAEIFATAGAPRKVAYLRQVGVSQVFSSRDLSFADQIRKATDGHGVNLVLNTLSDEFIPASLDLLAEGGWFVELGKRGVWTAEQVAERRPDVRFRAFDLADVAQDDPQLVRQMLSEILEDVESGAIQSLPCRVFDSDDVQDAFSSMARAEHIGKLVVHLQPDTRPAQWRSDSSYLITGGLGALGRAVAEHLLNEGAGHVVLTGRHGPDSSAEEWIQSLQSSGCSVEFQEADVAALDQLERLVESFDHHAKPLRGVIHAAGVVRDCSIMNQSWDDFADVLRPKVSGAWNLYQLTRNRALDCLVFFSSGAALVGWPGQGSYAAANAFLDSLAEVGWRSGAQVMSICWGPWSSGMAADVAPEAFRRAGFEALTEMEGKLSFQATLDLAHPRQVVARTRGRLLDHPDLLLNGKSPGLNDEASGDEAPPHARIRDQLQAATEAARPEMLRVMVEETIRETLGLPSRHRFDDLQPLKELGLDSLLSVQLRNALADGTGLSLPASLLFDFPTPAALRNRLQSELGLSPGTGDEKTKESGPTEPDLNSLSEAEAEALLLNELEDLESGQSHD